MIQSFADSETEKIWNGVRSRRFAVEVQEKALVKMRMLNQARRIEDLRIPPGNRLEYLNGDRKRQCSIRVNDQWRICFVWTEGGPADVEIVDYH